MFAWEGSALRTAVRSASRTSWAAFAAQGTHREMSHRTALICPFGGYGHGHCIEEAGAQRLPPHSQGGPPFSRSA